MEKSSDGLSKKFTSVGKTLTVGLTTPLTALATAGIKYNASMETYTANLTTLLNGNQKNFVCNYFKESYEVLGINP